MSKLENLVNKYLKLEFSNYQFKRNYCVYYNNSKLLFDFLIPELKVAIEVQGEQHYTFNKFYHSDKSDFIQQKYRDTLKTQWCDEHEYNLVTIHFSESETLTRERFRKLIIDAI